MALSQIPEWQYPLYKPSDKRAYEVMVGLARKGEWPILKGKAAAIDEFLKLLIMSQKMKDYRAFRDKIIEELEKNKTLNIEELVFYGKRLKIPKGIDSSWAIFTQDKRICTLIDEVREKRIHFEGSSRELGEFLLRFLLSQLLFDWRGPLMAVLLTCLEKERVNVKELNSLLSKWDYTSVFRR